MLPLGLLALALTAAAVIAKAPVILATVGLASHNTTHPASHRHAWSLGLHTPLPPNLVVDCLLGVAALLFCCVLGTLARELTSRGRRGRPDRAARWASRSELSELHTREPEPGRITLGEHNGRLIAAESRVSVLGVGPAQSGKTTGLIVPAVLEWQGPVLSTSVKADVVHDTKDARARHGAVLIFDPTGSTDLKHTAWSPISASTTWEGARRTAANLLGVGDLGVNQSADDAFWRPAGARYLAPLLLAAAYGERTMRDVLHWVAIVDKDTPKALLRNCSDSGPHPALEALESVWQADHRLKSSLMQTVATGLDAWQEPRIADATTGQRQIDAHEFLDGANTLYLIAPGHEQRRLRGLFTALVADITAAAFEASAREGLPIDPPLLVALDEAANIAPLPNLDEIASTGPGQGVQLLTILQNISQATDRWGRDRAETIIANHRARLFCSGIGDRATLDYLRQTLGEEEINRISTHRQNPLATGSRTYSTDFRSLAAPHRVRQADTNTALLIYGRLAPAWVSLRPWYADRALRDLKEGVSPRASRRVRTLSFVRRFAAVPTSDKLTK
jgi:type IV secretion system protein VirD4